jgi:hypothetical protein
VIATELFSDGGLVVVLITPAVLDGAVLLLSDSTPVACESALCKHESITAATHDNNSSFILKN